jgi:branched-chain amino acid transport system substrate-binding protein
VKQKRPGPVVNAGSSRTPRGDQVISTLARILGAAGAVALGATTAHAQRSDKPILIGVPTTVQAQVGRDTQDALQMLIDDLNAKGGILGRKIEMTVEDETEAPEQGVSAIKKLIDKKVDVLIGGYTSGVTLAQLPLISAAKTIYLGVGAASPAIQAKVKTDYANAKYIFRVGPINSVKQAEMTAEFIIDYAKPQLGVKKIAIIGEDSKWAQDLVPVLKKIVSAKGMVVPVTELFAVETSDFSPLLAKAKEANVDFLVTILSHASSDIFAKQWYDSRFPAPYGGIDVKSQDADFYTRVSGKAISEFVSTFSVDAPITSLTQPFYAQFKKRNDGREPVYTAPAAYDALLIYKAAVERAKSTEPDAVVKELEKTDFKGTRGRVVFDDTHDVKAGPGYLGYFWQQWQEGGKRVVVFPKENATGPFQMPPWIPKKAASN